MEEEKEVEKKLSGLEPLIEHKAENYAQAERIKDGVKEDCFTEVYRALAKGYKQGAMDILKEMK